MYLKSLTLSGFKSFGKTTVFEFPGAVTAIVGPNGSGKSNVAEAIRWVLGEQSMKSLRGKRGEDLIFNGSDSAARLGRAEVKLTFDNSKKQFPYEFDEVIVARRVLRDGTNEYLLNGSVVRLKDIFELLSKVGLGATQHHIISQGEVDRILWASISQRQEMIEEALGLKEYHLKIRDASRKLAETEANMKEVDIRRREIQPHLRYLKTQAEKVQAHESFRTELIEKALQYAIKEFNALQEYKKRIDDTLGPLNAHKKECAEQVRKLQDEIAKTEKHFTKPPVSNTDDEPLRELRDKQQHIYRELGRIEGSLAAAASTVQHDADPAIIVTHISDVLAHIDVLEAHDDVGEVRRGLAGIKAKLASLLEKMQGKNKSAAHIDLASEKEKLQHELRSVEKDIRDIQSKKEHQTSEREHAMVEIRKHERELREAERALADVHQKIRDVAFDEERYASRHSEWQAFVRDMKIEVGDRPQGVFESEAERSTLLRAIDRLRIKLEEAGGIDGSVIKEYEDTKNRNDFLAREVEDLERAQKMLADLTRELEQKLEEQFAEGLKKINAEFSVFFKNIFGGGKAALHYIKSSKGDDGEEQESGVDISLDIPRKRLRSLDMLSGGERALTSVALLFAMSAVNPPPFLVLDETDAALDEANSQRYGDLLAALSDKAQLIVITHNRGTMQRAGVLYGVTLGNDGISRVLSLKFTDAVEYAKEG